MQQAFLAFSPDTMTSCDVLKVPVCLFAPPGGWGPRVPTRPRGQAWGPRASWRPQRGHRARTGPGQRPSTRPL